MGSFSRSVLSTLIVFAFLVCLTKGKQLYKVNEAGSSPVSFHLCGDHIPPAYNQACSSTSGKRSSKRNRKYSIIFSKTSKLSITWNNVNLGADESQGIVLWFSVRFAECPRKTAGRTKNIPFSISTLTLYLVSNLTNLSQLSSFVLSTWPTILCTTHNNLSQIYPTLPYPRLTKLAWI